MAQKHKAIICRQMKKSEEIRRNQKAQKHKAIGCKLTSLMNDAFAFFFFGSGVVLIGSSWSSIPADATQEPGHIPAKQRTVV